MPITAGRTEAGGWMGLGGVCAGEGKGEGSLTGVVCPCRWLKAAGCAGNAPWKS